MKQTIYIDLLFLINFLMDSVILYTCSKILKRNLNILRLSSASAVAALYSTVAFFPRLSVLTTLFCKVIFFVIPSLIAFPTKSFIKVLKNTIVLSSVYAMFGGAVFILIFATDFGTRTGAAVSNGEIYINISSSILLLSTILAYLMVYVMSYVNNKNILAEQKTVKAEVAFSGKKVTVKALEDTGCSLTDPLSGKPVFILDRTIVQKLIPKDFWEYINDNSKNNTNHSNRYRILPYSTIGNNSGIMSGFVSDYVKFEDISIKSVVIGISPIQICENGEFEAIINPQILNNSEENFYHEEKSTI